MNKRISIPRILQVALGGALASILTQCYSADPGDSGVIIRLPRSKLDRVAGVTLEDSAEACTWRTACMPPDAGLPDATGPLKGCNTIVVTGRAPGCRVTVTFSDGSEPVVAELLPAL